MTLTAYSLCTIYARLVTTLALSAPVSIINMGYKQSYTSGTGAYQVQYAYACQATLGATATATFNIKSLVLQDAQGNSLVFSKWKLICFQNLCTTHAVSCCLGSNGNNNILLAAKIDKAECYGRSQFFQSIPVNGLTCASIFKVKNSTTTAFTYNLLILGV